MISKIKGRESAILFSAVVVSSSDDEIAPSSVARVSISSRVLVMFPLIYVVLSVAIAAEGVSPIVAVSRIESRINNEILIFIILSFRYSFYIPTIRETGGGDDDYLLKVS